MVKYSSSWRLVIRALHGYAERVPQGNIARDFRTILAEFDSERGRPN